MITPTVTPKEVKRQLRLLLDTDIPLFLHGSPGIGKSYIVNEIAAEKGWDIRDVRLSQLDAVDLRGLPSIAEERTRWVPPAFFPRSGEGPGILFLDEMNSAPLSVQAAVYQLILDRRVGEYELPSNWRIVCAGNRMEDRGIVFRLPAPLANRMVHLVMETSYQDFRAWAIQEKLHPQIIAFLGFRPDLLSKESPADSQTNPAFPTPRSWTMLSRALESVEKFADASPIIYGSVGYAAGAEFLAYGKVYSDLPDLSAILEGDFPDPPESPGALYALVSGLVERWNIQNLEEAKTQAKNLIAFSHKLPREFALLLMKDCVTKNELISDVEGFDQWLDLFSELII